MKKLIVANWKMNPKTLSEAVSLARKTGVVKKGAGELVICPPYPFLSGVQKVLNGAALGAQDMSENTEGPHTGEVSAGILKSVGVSYVILGHSERRSELGENDEAVNGKVLQALKAGLRVVLCIGEPIEIRKKGLPSASSFVKKQLLGCVAGIEKLGLKKKNLILAYEPVWAISTSKNRRNETPDDAAFMASLIKTIVREKFYFTPRVLYGGSVGEKDVRDFVSQKEVDGTLVGAASLRASEFRLLMGKVFE
ncbi:MAG: triose-phosphate isomerase [Patescibacteria group bacterium]